MQNESRIGRGNRHTFFICAFHFCVPTLTLTVLAMRPAETTIAFVCRTAEAAILWVDMVCCVMLGF